MCSAPLYQSPLILLDDNAYKKLIPEKSLELNNIQYLKFKNGNKDKTIKINVFDLSSFDEIILKKNFESMNIKSHFDHSSSNYKRFENKNTILKELSILLYIKDSIGLFQKNFKKYFKKNLIIFDYKLIEKFFHERRIIQLNYLQLVDFKKYNLFIQILNNKILKVSHFDYNQVKNFLCLQENETLNDFFQKFITSTNNRISTIETAIKGDTSFLDNNDIHYVKQNFVWSDIDPEYLHILDSFKLNINSSHSDIEKQFSKLFVIYKDNKERYEYIQLIKDYLISFNKETNIFFLKDKLNYLQEYYLYITSLVDKDLKKKNKLDKNFEKNKSDDQKMEVSSPKRWADESDDDDDIKIIDQKFNELDINKKNIPCKYFSRGSCNNGDTCKFKHENKSLNPNKFKTCSFFKKGNCSKGEDCSYSHVM